LVIWRYVDPQTGRQVTAVERKTKHPKQAAKRRREWEAELQEGATPNAREMSWDAFREYYCRPTPLPALAESSAGTYEASLNVVRRLLQTATGSRGDNGARDGIS